MTRNQLEFVPNLFTLWLLLGTCIDGFLFGVCCHVGEDQSPADSENEIEDGSSSEEESSASTEVPTSSSEEEESLAETTTSSTTIDPLKMVENILASLNHSQMVLAEDTVIPGPYVPSPLVASSMQSMIVDAPVVKEEDEEDEQPLDDDFVVEVKPNDIEVCRE